MRYLQIPEPKRPTLLTPNRISLPPQPPLYHVSPPSSSSYHNTTHNNSTATIYPIQQISLNPHSHRRLPTTTQNFSSFSLQNGYPHVHHDENFPPRRQLWVPSQQHQQMVPSISRRPGREGVNGGVASEGYSCLLSPLLSVRPPELTTSYRWWTYGETPPSPSPLPRKPVVSAISSRSSTKPAVKVPSQSLPAGSIVVLHGSASVCFPSPSSSSSSRRAKDMREGRAGPAPSHQLSPILEMTTADRKGGSDSSDCRGNISSEVNKSPPSFLPSPSNRTVQRRIQSPPSVKMARSPSLKTGALVRSDHFLPSGEEKKGKEEEGREDRQGKPKPPNIPLPPSFAGKIYAAVPNGWEAVWRYGPQPNGNEDTASPTQRDVYYIEFIRTDETVNPPLTPHTLQKVTSPIVFSVPSPCPPHQTTQQCSSGVSSPSPLFLSPKSSCSGSEADTVEADNIKKCVEAHNAKLNECKRERRVGRVVRSNTGPPRPPKSLNTPTSTPPRSMSTSYGPQLQGSTSYGPQQPRSISYGPQLLESTSNGPQLLESTRYGPQLPGSTSYGPQLPGSTSYGPQLPASTSNGRQLPRSTSNGPQQLPSLPLEDLSRGITSSSSSPKKRILPCYPTSAFSSSSVIRSVSVPPGRGLRHGRLSGVCHHSMVRNHQEKSSLHPLSSSSSHVGEIRNANGTFSSLPQSPNYLISLSENDASSASSPWKTFSIPQQVDGMQSLENYNRRAVSRTLGTRTSSSASPPPCSPYSLMVAVNHRGEI